MTPTFEISGPITDLRYAVVIANETSGAWTTLPASEVTPPLTVPSKQWRRYDLVVRWTSRTGDAQGKTHAP